MSGEKSFFEKFKEYLVREEVIDRYGVDDYMKVYFDRQYDFENLDSDLYNLADFLRQELARLLGEPDERFGIDVFFDYREYKYNIIKILMKAKIGEFEYWIVLGDYLCKWGTVADDPKDFDKCMGDFLKELKERAENLKRSIPQSPPPSPSPSTSALPPSADPERRPASEHSEI